MKRRVYPIFMTGEVFLFGTTLERVAEGNLTKQASQRRSSHSLRRRSAIAFMGRFAIGFAGILGAIAFSGNPVVAQITPDATLGSEGSIVAPNANVRGFPAELIEGGATRGANLFHSFEQFNVEHEQRVYFANPTGIENILTRVTGNTLSNILGTLGVDGGANLFLLNPNCIIFGPNARLDIAGSFVASTANSLVFENGTQFSATNPEAPPLLTINVTPGLQYGTTQPRATITNSGNLSVGQNLTLSAGNLDLQGQLQAGGDLTLFAQDIVKVRDSITNPFVASSGGQLLVQGNYGIDILALNHPTLTPFVSGGALSLVSDGMISGDARFSSGGSFSIRSASGQLATFLSLYDPIISANGDVDVAADYTGTSLLIEATGNIQFHGNINITGPDTNTLPPGPDTATLTTSSALILRSGQSVLAYGGVNSGAAPAFGTGVVPAGITIGGDVTLQPLNSFGGTVNLSATSGNVNIQSVTTNGGSIAINSLGNITTNNLISKSLVDPGNAGNGGAITLTAINGNINTGFLESFSLAFSGTAGDGGAITLTATNGSINTDYLKSYSDSFFGPDFGLVSGNGSPITLTAANDITTGDLFSYSGANPGDTGNGSDIMVTTTNGNITTGTLYSYSGALNGNASNGGNINLSAANGSITTGDMDTQAFGNSGAGNGGSITINSLGNITTNNVVSKSFADSGNASNGGEITLTATNGNINTGSLESKSFANPGNAGNGGAMTLTATKGNINTGYLESFSLAFSGTSGDGGAIRLTASNGSINTDYLKSYSDSFSGPALGLVSGNGGAITLTTANDITTGDLFSYSGANPGDAGNGSNITVTTTNGNITTGTLYSYSGALNGNASNGGEINLSAANGSITTSNMDAQAFGGSGAGNGGKINLLARNDITTQVVNNFPASFDATVGNGKRNDITMNAGGNIFAESLNTNSDYSNGSTISLRAGGNITAEDLYSSSEEGNGGAIFLTAGGSISTLYIESFSFDGNGGDVALSAGNNISAMIVYTGSGLGNGGAIALTAFGDISTVYLGSSTFLGNGGKINITSEGGAFSVQDAAIETNTLEQGNAGSIWIDAASVSLINTDVSTTVTGAGNSGRISIVADDTVLLDRSRLFTSVDSDTTGNGGNINIEAKSVSLTTFSYIDTATFGQGNAGNLLIKAEDSVSLDSSSIFSNTTGQGNAGTVTVQARGNTLPPNVTLTNRSNISTAVNPTAEGNGGDININANSLLIAGGSQIQSRTRGQGNATNTIGRSGNIGITADSVTISGIQDGFLSGVFTSTDAIDSGQGGTINITTPGTLLVTDGGILSAQTSSTSRGGDIFVQANTMELRNGGQLLTSTTRSGQAGDILVNAVERVTTSGVDPNFDNRISPDNRVASCIVAGIACSNAANPNVESSTRVPYVSIPATGTGQADTYTFEVTAGTRAIFDIDNGLKYAGNNTLTQTPQSVDTIITLLDSQGNSLINNSLTNNNNDNSDDALVNLGAGGSIPLRVANSTPPPPFTDSENSNDSYLRYVFTEPGRYSIQVGEGDTGVKVGGTYTLQVSLENPNVAGSVIDANPASGLFARTQGDGAAGNVTINTPQLDVLDRAQVSASTSGSGQGGSLTVTAPQAITLSGNSQLSVETSGAGQAGDATITTQRLTLNEGARVSATATATATTSEPGGSISVNASQINLSGNNSGLFAETQGTAPAGSLILQPNINGQTLTVNFQDGAKISASTSGSGQGGSLIVTAPQAVTLRGNGELSAETSGTGGAGDVRLNTPRLTVRDGTRVSASTSGVGEGGSLRVNAAESVELSGTSSLSVEATAGSTAGDLMVTTREMFVQDGANVTVSSPQGQAGDLTITANSLRLNRGTISAETGKSTAEGGANITLQGLDILFMQNESLISANAKDAANGGNITIDSTLILATPPQGSIGSDIVANAEQGNGGRVNVTTQGLFGIEFRPQRTPKNDITVSSTFGVSGEYILNSPGIDPSRGLAELPTNVVDATEQIDRRCTPAGRTGERSSFTVTGRGGLPPSPNEPLRGESAIANWISLDSDSENNTSSDTPTPKSASPRQLVEAQGWMINEKGEVILTASAQQVTPQAEWLNSADCK